jgi:hypothetical protein
MKTYLTIDLDFWTANEPDLDFLNRVARQIGENVACAVHHHHILGHVAAFHRATRLINIDAHSDLPHPITIQDFPEDEPVRFHNQLNTGAWGIYVDWPHRELFSWIGPSEESLHEGQIVQPWEKGGEFSECEQMEEGRWERLESCVGRPPDYGVELAEVIGASIVLSPDWCAPNAVPVFLGLIEEYDLPVLDMLPADLRSVTVTPCSEPEEYQQIIVLVHAGIPLVRWPARLRAALEDHVATFCPETRLVRRCAGGHELTLYGLSQFLRMPTPLRSKALAQDGFQINSIEHKA